MSKILTSCRESNHICDKSQYKESSFFERIKLNLHLLYCKACRKYTKENIILTKYIKKSKKENETKLNDALFHCLGKLPAKQSEVFRLKTMLNYKTKVICKEFNISVTNFWMNINKARIAMSDCMEKTWLK